ncbi:tRNA (cytidine(34)-2'-O)-methyltransferase [uncultured Desulfatiglans sp.]|nr:tRNA (cytidine(34)-2'-O)-methyltransferase [uncultured Desulfatiglans sp.]
MDEHPLSEPTLHIVLYEPEIPANTGNIARLCAAARLRLHLIHPLGFKVDDRHLKRAGLDYWPEVDVVHHPSFDAYLIAESMAPHSVHAFSRHAEPLYTKACVQPGDHLLFGPETRGLPAELRSIFHFYAIPIWGKVRSLNLSTSVGIVAYHYLHTIGRF